eukprot:GHVU01059185.1.p1 GENE.GHVU01059185.1~~GHVU01059185.1.p1  ORF type:complete len:106 (+),score=6.80 GHVU01059185.1:596-913(+)
MTSDTFRILVEVRKRPIMQTVMQSLQAAPPRICFTVRCWHLERSQASGAKHLSYEWDFAYRNTADVPSWNIKTGLAQTRTNHRRRPQQELLDWWRLASPLPHSPI